MRLLNEPAGKAIAALALSAVLGGCSMFGGGGGDLANAEMAPLRTASVGPQADYPMVLGDPFTIDGQEFVPTDTASYDAVGFAAADNEGGQGVTVAHKTLPMPSYVELTELDTGRTILARVERRGPMTASRLVALSPGAMAALGVSDGAPVRVRRVNPPETDRAELRAGRKASDRMDTPKSLLGVLQRKLPNGLAASSLPASPVELASLPAAAPKAPAATPAPARANGLFVEDRRANTAYPLGGRPVSKPASEPVAVAATAPKSPAAAPAVAASAPASGEFVVQAAAFSSKANADRAANKIGGFVTQVGSLYRVRMGPYTTRGQAEAALAKVREAGYSDARVFTAG